MNYYLNIGSNIGNRRRNISRAVDLIKRTFGTEVRCSRPVESMPWGFDSDNAFVNEGIVLHTDHEPTDVLSMLQGVERLISDASHRNSDGSYRDRVIDIDIVAIDQLTIEAKDAEALTAYFAANAKALLDKGVTITQANGIATDFTITSNTQGYKIAFGEEELVAYFQAFLRPKLVEMLF